MSMKWIRETYKVPAKRGGRVEVTSRYPTMIGTITGSSGQYLRIRLDKDPAWNPRYHPTWGIRYVESDEASA